MTPLVRLKLADADIDETLEFYLEQSPALGSRFIDALERAFRHIQRHPATGSPRYGHELDLPGLRFWPLSRFPQLVFYMAHPDRIQLALKGVCLLLGLTRGESEMPTAPTASYRTDQRHGLQVCEDMVDTFWLISLRLP